MNYPSSYPPNTVCTWLFNEDTPGTYVISVLDLQTEYYDPLTMGYGRNISGPLRQRLSLWYYPKTILMESLAIWMHFASNHAAQFRGFLVTIERKPHEGRFLEVINLSKCH